MAKCMYTHGTRHLVCTRHSEYEVGTYLRYKVCRHHLASLLRQLKDEVGSIYTVKYTGYKDA